MNEKETISYIINTSKNIAIFALSPDKTKASYRVAEFLQRKNYKIFPIYPKEEF
ncbi:CoA-binding protein, partial [Campylobacter jejuni]|nr:CoA-binding protein [Campylobacter jejuni]EAH9547709.1 CoA-binding protein [Campylobacter jejuni]EAI2550197.1 CoA-binding protein [Campylobacter jejuni]EAJ1150883.1 CoA-binding protein [Campylobacter jejuni]EAJ2093660.1 CoA-binding protein [Campylobacter jejuni]